ncbi:M50 family metallopeptidase [Ferrimicrobium acidiphilum]|uniref:M50 family metallopeptidase n=1 Tax=Ferrimicrobium acidiphilum TaxID=121039 RepID=UPI0023F5921A|nr:site-2 protease family protein [Ferrimicrobium acidiphilum]
MPSIDTVDGADTSENPEPSLAEARSFSGRRLIEFLIVIAAIIAFAAHVHALSTLVVVAAIAAMIILHEFGHYITARLSGMKVTEFFIGFGPRIWSFKVGGIEYGIKALIVGGYVRIAGMTNVEEVPPQDEARTYRQSTFPRRILVSVAGSLMHFIMAFAILWVLLSGVGFAVSNGGTYIASVAKAPHVVSPAYQAHIPAGSTVLAVNGIHHPSTSTFGKIIETSANKPVHLTLRVGSKVLYRTVVPVSASVLARTDPVYKSLHGSGVIGVTIESTTKTVTDSLVAGADHAVTGLGSYAWSSVAGILSHFSPHGIATYAQEVVHPSSSPTSARSQSRFESPVGIVYLANDAVRAGIAAVLELLFLINVFVGVFNLFPFLPLDGGHVVIAIYERIRSRKNRRYHADVMKLMPVTYAVLAIILLIGVTSLYLDITHPIFNPFG